jgi:methionine-gamma-lyase
MTTKEGEEMKFETRCIHGKIAADPSFRSLVTPIYQTSTFGFRNLEEGKARFAGTEEGYMYSRLGNPTVCQLEQKLAALDGGEAALAFSSGMAATSSAILALSAPGKNIITSDTIYGGTYNMFNRTLPHLGIEVREAHIDDYTHYESLIDKDSSLIFIETPANPTLGLIDIEKVAAIGKKHGIPVICDNTFATSYFQKPLKLGVDIVMHSATKYSGGHGDVIAGALVGSKELICKIKKYAQNDFGGIIAPFEAWLLLRGLKTLPVRMERHFSNAMTIARWLEQHPKVTRVWYPMLESHPDYVLAKKQMSGFSGMVAFEVQGGKEGGEILMNEVKLIMLAVSLGDCDSLIQHPVSMTHSGYSCEDLEKTGISDGLIRLSVGLEHTDDIIADLQQALEKIPS